MHFGQRDVGNFRIYAGALEAPGGGYTASVVVHKTSSAPKEPQVVFSDYKLFGGYRFEEPASALVRAMDVGHRTIRMQPVAA